MPDLVFVYGTLRRGQHNHYMLGSSSFLGLHVTEPWYAMLDLGTYPGVVGGGQCAITGELYRVTPTTLARLDELEDYPQRYDRVVFATEHGRAWIYLYRHQIGSERVIVSGDWLR
jgi:gamma-glutamylcyclotransferase (GGCT)/AIG2-like uncharacterized protein YtfP